MRFESSTAAPLRPTWTTTARGAFNLLLGAWLLVLAIAKRSGFLGVIALPALLLGARTTRRPDRSWVAKPGQLVADERGILIDGTLVVERRHLVIGVVAAAHDGPARVQLSRLWPRAPLFIEVATEGDGNALLEALELGASHAAGVFELPSPTRRQGVPWFLLAALLLVPALLRFGEAGKLVSLPVFLAALALAVVRSAIKQRVALGADGIAITWLSQRRLIPYREVKSVHRIARNERMRGFRGPGVGITLVSGELVALPIDPTMTEVETLAACERLAHRIEEATAGAAPRRAAGQPEISGPPAQPR